MTWNTFVKVQSVSPVQLRLISLSLYAHLAFAHSDVEPFEPSRQAMPDQAFKTAQDKARSLSDRIEKPSMRVSVPPGAR